MIVDKNYITRQSHSCVIGCIENYFYFFGVPISGYDICFYSQGFDIQYSYDGKKEFYIQSPFHSLDIVSEWGISYETKKLDMDNEAIRQYLIDLILNEKAIIIEMDTKKIKYDSVFQNYQSIYHSFNLIGYHSESDEFCISDGFIPGYNPSAKQFWIPASEFMESWSKHRQLTILDQFEMAKNVQLNTKEILRKQLEKYLKGSKNGEIYCGKFAIERLLSDFRGMITDDWDMDIVVNLNYQLHVYGFFMAREYLYSFLRANDLVDYAEKVYTINEAWKKQCLILVKAFAVKSEARVEKVIKSLNELCCEEESIYAGIIKELR